MTKPVRSAFSVAARTALLALITITFFQIIQAVSAETLESDSYIIQFGNFNVTSGEKSSTSFSVTDTVGQVGAGPYGAYGSSSFFLGAGFQYIYQISDFSFIISDINMELGTLTPGAFSSDSHTLTISTRGAGGYTVYAYELHELRHISTPAYTIPDTACDSSSCTISSAGLWTNTSTTGFGYNVNGDDVPSDFLDASHYRPFANDEESDPMQVVMSSTNVASNKQSTVTYKANVSGSQAAGNYETAVVYVAVPGY